MIRPITANKPPRISANQLGEFIFATEKKQISILQDQKFGNINSAPYYSCAQAAARRSFKNGHFSEVLLRQEDKVAIRNAETSRQATKWANNARALVNLAEIADASNPPAGEHRMVTRNAQLLIQGVTISILPEIVTENLANGIIAYTKLRFSKSKITADVSEIVLLLLHHYGQGQNRPGLEFNFENSKVVDCFSKLVIWGHAVGRQRHQQLHKALQRINWLWPRIEPK